MSECSSCESKLIYCRYQQNINLLASWCVTNHCFIQSAYPICSFDSHLQLTLSPLRNHHRDSKIPPKKSQKISHLLSPHPSPSLAPRLPSPSKCITLFNANLETNGDLPRAPQSKTYIWTKILTCFSLWSISSWNPAWTTFSRVILEVIIGEGFMDPRGGR